MVVGKVVHFEGIFFFGFKVNLKLTLGDNI